MMEMSASPAPLFPGDTEPTSRPQPQDETNTGLSDPDPASHSDPSQHSGGRTSSHLGRGAGSRSPLALLYLPQAIVPRPAPKPRALLLIREKVSVPSSAKEKVVTQLRESRQGAFSQSAPKGSDEGPFHPGIPT